MQVHLTAPGSRALQLAPVPWLAVIVLLLAGLFPAPPAQAIVSSQAVVYINDLIGADAFYNAGYTGTRAVVANIEGGRAWNLHETLTALETFLVDPVGSGPQLGDYDAHPTEVAQIIAGQGTENYQKGIAYGSELWSGAIATEYPDAPTSSNFNYSRTSLLYPYETAMKNGVSGRKANVINSSWGTTGSNTTGFDYASCMIDSLAYANGQTVTLAAGNSGPTPNTVLSPARAYNVITVGATGNDLSTPPYKDVATFSSRGPGDYYDPETGDTIVGVRAIIDLVAPGHVLKLAKYGGTTGSNTGGIDPTGGATNMYHTYQTGTSFSSPAVAGGAALVVDVGYDRYGGGQAVDGRVVKAVLMNSATKPTGWNNGQAVGFDDAIRTTQSLDHSSGAGQMNLDQAFLQYTEGTHNVAGNGGGSISSIGWDYGLASSAATNDYFITPVLAGLSKFNVTLTWFVKRSYSNKNMNIFNEVNFDNLDLQVWETDGSTLTTLVAESSSQFNNTEHLSFTLPHNGQYALRVVWNGENFDFEDVSDSEIFGLAWSGFEVPILGDLNGDGLVTLSDINPFKLALTDMAAYQILYPRIFGLGAADTNGDGSVTLSDIPGFIELLASGSSLSYAQSMTVMSTLLDPSLSLDSLTTSPATISTAIPEPAGLLWAVSALFFLRRHHRA
ncbi:MAG: S8 family serine peptidase [Phycisphaeraceae bacterium]|nr:S8 family serine peptidase [Phycisphaeraceae bacterium]